MGYVHGAHRWGRIKDHAKAFGVIVQQHGGHTTHGLPFQQLHDLGLYLLEMGRIGKGVHAEKRAVDLPG